MPEYKLKVGDVGTVVDITPNGRQYTLEFFNYAGDTIAVVSVQPSQIRPIAPEREITSVRVLGE